MTEQQYLDAVHLRTVRLARLILGEVTPSLLPDGAARKQFAAVATALRQMELILEPRIVIEEEE